MYRLPFDKVSAIADRTTAPASAPRRVSLATQRLLASISPNLPLPAPGQKYSVSSIDALLADKGMTPAQRLHLKARLHDAGLL
jgi:hypothetical protein